MANTPADYMKDIMATPLGELITSLGNGVADAQMALDEASLAKTLEIYGNADDKQLELMRQIGYQPTFYAIPETEVEASVSLSIATAPNTTNGLNKQVSTPKTKIYTAPTNAANTNKYNIQSNASTKLKFKIVAVPPSNAVSNIRIAPNLIGKNEIELQLILSQLNLQYEIGVDNSSTTVTKQTPAAGSILNADDVLILDF